MYVASYYSADVVCSCKFRSRRIRSWALSFDFLIRQHCRKPERFYFYEQKYSKNALCYLLRRKFLQRWRCCSLSQDWLQGCVVALKRGHVSK
jgi:hypothetical protein